MNVKAKIKVESITYLFIATYYSRDGVKLQWTIAEKKNSYCFNKKLTLTVMNLKTFNNFKKFCFLFYLEHLKCAHTKYKNWL